MQIPLVDLVAAGTVGAAWISGVFYDSALGNLEDAKERLTRAFEPEKGLRLKALDEPDLEPLWNSLGESE